MKDTSITIMPCQAVTVLPVREKKIRHKMPGVGVVLVWVWVFFKYCSFTVQSQSWQLSKLMYANVLSAHNFIIDSLKFVIDFKICRGM